MAIPARMPPAIPQLIPQRRARDIPPPPPLARKGGFGGFFSGRRRERREEASLNTGSDFSVGVAEAAEHDAAETPTPDQHASPAEPNTTAPDQHATEG